MEQRQTYRMVVTRYAGLVVCGLTIFVGCQQSPPPPPPFKGNVTYRNIHWGLDLPPQKRQVPGIDHAAIYYLVWDSRIALAIWTDADNSNNSSNNSLPTSQGSEGKFTASIGDKVEVKFTTADGKTGPLTVNGQSFELSGGWLVLVSTANGKTTVKQLQRDALTLVPDIKGGNYKDFEKLKADPEVAGFFAKEK